MIDDRVQTGNEGGLKIIPVSSNGYSVEIQVFVELRLFCFCLGKDLLCGGVGLKFGFKTEL